MPLSKMFSRVYHNTRQKYGYQYSFYYEQKPGNNSNICQPYKGKVSCSIHGRSSHPTVETREQLCRATATEPRGHAIKSNSSHRKCMLIKFCSRKTQMHTYINLHGFFFPPHLTILLPSQSEGKKYVSLEIWKSSYYTFTSWEPFWELSLILFSEISEV